MTPTSVFLFLTRTCNLTCRHCYMSARSAANGHMNFDDFCRIVDLFLAQGIDDFRLTGGEPTINPEFDKMLNRLNSKGIAPRLITNGINLMWANDPQAILYKVSKCWISVYGISPKEHLATGGVRCRSLEDTLEFAGKQSANGHWVGVSALLTTVNLVSLKNFITLAKKHGVRFLRFLFAEPSGRAVTNGMSFAFGANTLQNAISILDFMRHLIDENAFEFLSMNNPFDLESKHVSGQSSCMLHTRRMWSIAPEGYIYSCCFNIDEPAHYVANALSHSYSDALSNKDVVNYASACKGLDTTFWIHDCGVTTCPLSAISFTSV